jgi:CHAT domain-containing protein
LNDPLVILSACNTAESYGTPGAETLSGLARSFFAAGARNLLVSYWSIPSEATRFSYRGSSETWSRLLERAARRP